MDKQQELDRLHNAMKPPGAPSFHEVLDLEDEVGEPLQVFDGVTGNPGPAPLLLGPLTKKEALAAAVVFSGDAVQAAWKASELKHLQLISTNKQYRALPMEHWNKALAMHGTEHAYTPDFYDCDTFSAVFSGWVAWTFEINGVARVLDNSAHHSYNAILVAREDGTCEWQKVEPQADILVDSPPADIRISAPANAYVATAGFAITV